MAEWNTPFSSCSIWPLPQISQQID